MAQATDSSSIPLSVQEAAAAVLQLINATPRTPWQDEIAAVIARVVPSAPAPVTPFTLKLRELRLRLYEAVLAEVNTEGKPGYEAACEIAQRLDSEFEALAREVWDRPATSVDDLAQRTEIAL